MNVFLLNGERLSKTIEIFENETVYSLKSKISSIDGSNISPSFITLIIDGDASCSTNAGLKVKELIDEHSILQVLFDNSIDYRRFLCSSWKMSITKQFYAMAYRPRTNHIIGIDSEGCYHVIDECFQVVSKHFLEPNSYCESFASCDSPIFSQSGEYIFYASETSAGILINTITHQQRVMLHEYVSEALYATFSTNDENIFIMSSENNSEIHEFNVASGVHVKSLKIAGIDEDNWPVDGLALANDDTSIIIAFEDRIVLLNMASGAQLEKHFEDVGRCKVSHDGSYIQVYLQRNEETNPSMVVFLCSKTLAQLDEYKVGIAACGYFSNDDRFFITKMDEKLFVVGLHSRTELAYDVNLLAFKCVGPYITTTNQNYTTFYSA